jgi:hypothetical protein
VLGQLDAIDSIALKKFWATGRPSAVSHSQETWPIPCYRCCPFSERLGQLDAIDSIALKKFWAAGKPSAVTGSWPTSCYRQHLI